MLKSPISRSGSDSQLVRHLSQEEFEQAATIFCQEGNIIQLRGLFENYFYFVLRANSDFFYALLDLCLQTNNSCIFVFLIKYFSPQIWDTIFLKIIEKQATNVLAFFLRNIIRYPVSSSVLGKVLEETAVWRDKLIFSILIKNYYYPTEVLTSFLETAIINSDTNLLTLLLDHLKTRNALLPEGRFLAFLEDCRYEKDDHEGNFLIDEESYQFMKQMLESFNDPYLTDCITRLSLASSKI